jgi:hypothetical protein
MPMLMVSIETLIKENILMNWSKLRQLWTKHLDGWMEEKWTSMLCVQLPLWIWSTTATLFSFIKTKHEIWLYKLKRAKTAFYSLDNETK